MDAYVVSIDEPNPIPEPRLATSSANSNPEYFLVPSSTILIVKFTSPNLSLVSKA